MSFLSQALKRSVIASLVAASWFPAAIGHATQGPSFPFVEVWAAASDTSPQTTHATPLGSSISLVARAGRPFIPFYFEEFDVYVGMMTPDGRILSLIGDATTQSLVAVPAPVPLLRGVTLEDVQRFSVSHLFTPRAPQGWYALFGVVVETGAAFSDPRNWIGTSFFPLLVHPDTGQAGPIPTSLPIVPAIWVEGSTLNIFGSPIHAIPVGASTSIVGTLNATRAIDFPGGFDVYIGVSTPDGLFMSLVGDSTASSLVAGPAPVPWLVGAAIGGSFRRFEASHRFTPDEPRGWYVLYGVIVARGDAFSDPRKWISTSFFPLLVE